MKKQRGNTLIELLVATVIVGVMLTGIAISLTYSIQREAVNRYREGATSLAEEISEYILLKRAQESWPTFFAGLNDLTNYCYFPADPPTFTEPLPGSSCATINKLGMDFTPTVLITKPPAGSPEKITAKITIEWEVDAKTKTYVLTQEYYEREY